LESKGGPNGGPQNTIMPVTRKVCVCEFLCSLVFWGWGNHSVRKRNDRLDNTINTQMCITLPDRVLWHSQVARAPGIMVCPCWRGGCRTLHPPFNMVGCCTFPKQPTQPFLVYWIHCRPLQLCMNRASRSLARKVVEHVSCLVASHARSHNKATSVQHPSPTGIATIARVATCSRCLRTWHIMATAEAPATIGVLYSSSAFWANISGWLTGLHLERGTILPGVQYCSF